MYFKVNVVHYVALIVLSPVCDNSIEIILGLWANDTIPKDHNEHSRLAHYIIEMKRTAYRSKLIHAKQVRKMTFERNFDKTKPQLRKQKNMHNKMLY